MRELMPRHLIVGAGLLGLSIADRLLRAGARNVVLIDRRTAPTGAAADTPDFVLGTCDPSYSSLEKRGLELIEEAPSFLNVSQTFRRCGALSLPVLLEPEGVEILDAGTAVGRFPSLRLEPGVQATFQPDDGVIDGAALAAALLASVRGAGAHVIQDCELLTIAREGNGVRFSANSREGVAERVYLSAGAGTIPLLRGPSIPCDYSASTWHRFELAGGAGPALLLRLEGDAPGIVHDSGSGRIWIEIRADGSDDVREEPVDWNLLGRFRKAHAPLFPALVEARIRRATTSRRLDLAPRAPGVICAWDGALRAGGAFGAHAYPLAQCIAELMAHDEEPAGSAGQAPIRIAP